MNWSYIIVTTPDKKHINYDVMMQCLWCRKPIEHHAFSQFPLDRALTYGGALLTTLLLFQP